MEATLTTTRTTRRWTLIDTHPDAQDFARQLKVPPMIAQLLLHRGYADEQAAKDFLSPSLKHLLDPDTLPGIPAAAARLARAIREKQKIVIYGDYDVDGITAVAILWHAFRALGHPADYYIPHRLDEGYGLNEDAVNYLADEGYQVLITVDCGITAIDQVALARTRGMDVVVTDHHEWRSVRGPSSVVRGEEESPLTTDHGQPTTDTPQLPDALLVHPRLPGAETKYENPSLCGAGVAFKLAWAVGKALTGSDRVTPEMREFLIEATALAALGTIADVVPLTGENRTLAYFGLQGLKHTKLRGLRALIASAGLENAVKIDSVDVGFKLGPRLNAAGRMGHAKQAAKLLTDATDIEAQEIADFLETANRERQATEKQIVKEACERIDAEGLAGPERRAIVLAGDIWHAGVIGICCSRLVERYCRPVVMLGKGEDGVLHGSGRSISGFHLAHALTACGQHLLKHGGHEMAAGLACDPAHFDAFAAALIAYANEHIAVDELTPCLTIELSAKLDEINLGLVKLLNRLGPFGAGNRKPTISLPGLRLAAKPRIVGKTGKHASLVVQHNNTVMKCIAFNRPDLAELDAGTELDLAAQPMLNEWNGRVSVELEVKDVLLF